LAISDKNGRTLIWEATLLVLYGMTPIDIYILRNGEVTILNVSTCRYI